MSAGTWRVSWVVLALLIAGCSGRPVGNLVTVEAVAPGTSSVDMIVATTRAPVSDPTGVLFGGERSRGLRFADISISIPPDSQRTIGDIQWPSRPPGDPARDFVTRSVQELDLAGVKADFHKKLAASKSKQVLVFVHGYNTRFEEAVYRFAQVVHDAGADVVPVLFTWPSRGEALSYFYDRDSAMYSRDALEAVLNALVQDSGVRKVAVLAHSMGNYVTVETLRQMAIRNKGLPPKISDIMLASPDIDFDVFRRQIAEIEQHDKAPPITLFVSLDDKALGLSKLIFGDEARLGAVDPSKDPYREILEQAHVHVVDLTSVHTDDALNHGKFASSDVVASIGKRLATGQALSDGKATIGEAVGAIAINTAGVTAKVTQAATSFTEPGYEKSAEPIEQLPK
jgi:esterase/lipase superfamily enzyme